MHENIRLFDLFARIINILLKVGPHGHFNTNGEQ